MELLPEHVATAIDNLIAAHRDEFATAVETAACAAADDEVMVLGDARELRDGPAIDFGDETLVGLVFNGAADRVIAHVSISFEAI